MAVAPALGAAGMALGSHLNARSDIEKEKQITERERMKIEAEKEKRGSERKWDAVGAATWLAGQAAPLALKYFTKS